MPWLEVARAVVVLGSVFLGVGLFTGVLLLAERGSRRPDEEVG